MKTIIRNKKITTIALVLLMASVLLTVYTPVQAQEPEQPVSGPLPAGVTPSVTVDVVAYLSFRPNPVGVGQTILVNFWVTPPLNPERFHPDYKVTITDPDGNEDVITMDSYCADATAWFEYVVDQVGTWTLKFDFAGTYFPAGRYRDGYVVPDPPGNVLDSAYYKPASTAEQELVVQEEQVLSWPPSPLPTDYWTRPVSLENREWWPIAGNYPPYGIVGGGPYWPADTNRYMSNYHFIPYVQAPNTAHIVWKRLGALAGLIGGTAGQYGTMSSPGNPSVIYAGRCYQTYTKPGVGSVAACYDLRTGEIYYEIPTAEGGVTPTVISYTRGTGEAVPGATESNTYSVSLLSLGSTLSKINPYTGAVTTSVPGMSPTTIGGGFDAGDQGAFHDDPYVLSMQNLGSFFNPDYHLINWTTAGNTDNFTQRVVGNISLPWGMPIWPGGCLGFTGTVYDFEVGVAVWMVGIAVGGTGAYYGTWMQAINLKTGALLWNITVPDTRYSTSCLIADHGKVAVLMENGYWMCWDSLSGNFLWKSELMDYPWGQPSFGAYAVQSAYGMFYRQSYDGVYAFDWDDGSIVWHYKAPSVPYETPYSGDTSFNSGAMVADGKLYTYNSEHTTTWPRTRGWKLHCINATTGEGIWNITGSQIPGAIADGYLVAANMDDGYMYVYGKGKSTTTIEAPMTAIPLGESIVIKGTVLDMSPAQPGTPCVSKESMSGWMEYLHMQRPIPADVTGVPVSLDTLDPNGNFIHIGDVTTDMSGMFSYMWTPEIPGKFTVIATFMGDDSYGSSYAETAVGVTEAPEEPPTPVTEPEVQEDVNQAIDKLNSSLTPILYGTIVAVAVAIVIGIISLLDHRRLRK